jgi:GNAT superfamily N-acetyltransferase
MRSVGRTLEDLNWYIQRYGVLRTSKRMLSRSLRYAARRIYSGHDTVIHCADLQSWPDYEAQERLTIRRGAEADLARLARRMPPSSIRTFRARLDEGQIMFIAEVDGELAGYAWMCTRTDSHAAKSHGLELKPGEGLHWDSATFPEFQRQGIYTALQRFSRAFMKSRGYSRVYGGADTSNPAPLRMMKKLGLKPVRLLRLRRILGRERRWVEAIPPDFRL